MEVKSVTLAVIALLHFTNGCQFHPPGEYLRFVRVPENLRVGEEILRVDVFPRRNLSLRPIDKEEDVRFFTFKPVNRTSVSLVLAKSLENLVDTDNPRNVLKFKLSCEFDDGENEISSSLSITVYVEDVNDHSPVFENAPYHITVDELTPVGLTIFRGIKAHDRDKPNTPNSDVQYAITSGNDKNKFALDSSHQAFLVLKNALDYDSGDQEFLLTITASDRGVPARSTLTTVRITVKDNDDLNPKFTKGVYRTKIPESYPLKGEKMHDLLRFDPPIHAFDQDLSINSKIRYDIIAGNERKLFFLDQRNGSMFLEKEIDLESEKSLPGNSFVLQIQATQLDNPTKFVVARVEVEVIDLNDNLPEFEADIYNISIVENLPNGFSVLQIIAKDQDQGDNAEFSFQLEDKSRAFALDGRTGWLSVKDQTLLDREKRSVLNMRVYAKEKVDSLVTTRKLASYVDVTVTLLDANDNNPTFIPNNIYDFSIDSGLKKDDFVGQVHAIDPDLGGNGLVNYNIQRSTNTSVFFKIDGRTGRITVASLPLLEGKYVFFVEASDQPENPSEKRTSLAVITVDVKAKKLRTSANLPEFIGAPYEFWVGANVEVGTSVGQIRVSNVDDREVMYDLLHGYHKGVPFAVEEKSGTITVLKDLDKFDRINYDFEAVVNAKKVVLNTNVTIHVVDPLDKNVYIKSPTKSPLEFHVRENHPNQLIGRIVLNSTNKPFKFYIANHHDILEQIKIFNNGSLYTSQALDREKRDNYRLTIIAEYNKGYKLATEILQVIIQVDDENDNPPIFESTMYEGTIKENSVYGTEVLLKTSIIAKDADQASNGQFSLHLQGENSDRFRLERFSGKIFYNTNTLLDHEDKNLYDLKIIAKDKGGLSSSAKLIIKVEDENDNPPIFTNLLLLSKKVKVQEYDDQGNRVALYQEKLGETLIYSLSQSYVKARGKARIKSSPIILINEDLTVGAPVIKLQATDKDSPNNSVVKYELVSETFIPNKLSKVTFQVTQYFSINSITGELITTKHLPAESEFRLNLTASDRGGLKDFLKVRIFVKDVNDHPPVFVKSWYNFEVIESPYSREVLGKIEATDEDYGQNANISYKIVERDLPFKISEFSGVLSVDGELDREKLDKYSFKILAHDNPVKNERFNSTVDITINIVDLNDNAPEFYNYDDVIMLASNDSKKYRNHQVDEYLKVPLYYATISENAPVGSPVIKVFANDSDYIGNGNGLILFDLKRNHDNLFTIDSKEGLISTISGLDYEKQSSHNLTIIASDLGSPSLTSTALLHVKLIDVQEDLGSLDDDRPVFAHRYYEVEVEENVPVPLKVLSLNVTEAYKSYKLRYSIVDDSSDPMGMFKIDSRNGSLFIVKSPDRELGAYYQLRIRLDQYKVGRDMTVMVYPVTKERLGDLGLNEVKVIIRITDVNDNAPRFTISGRPIIAAIPSTASFGHHVVRLQATDPDLGENGEVRYQILGRPDEGVRRFGIDPITGQVRAISSFARDAGKVFGFDVKATDRKGADDGISSIANVFVYVLDETNQLVMVMGAKPTEVEKNMDNITLALFNATGYDVRVRKLEPHFNKNQIDNSATDMYLYAVDPKLNTIIDMEELQSLLLDKRAILEEQLKFSKVLSLDGNINERPIYTSRRVILSSLEIGVVALGCIVFIGALFAAICVLCIKRRKNSVLDRMLYTPSTNLGFPGKLGLFPATFDDGFNYNNAGFNQQQQQHDYKCPRYAGSRPSFVKERSRSVGALETSIASIHSSGKDSGIAVGLQCHCGHSTQSSDESSNGYEDSLQSLSHGKIHDSFRYGSTREIQDYYNRRRSFSDEIMLSSTKSHRPHHHSQLGRIPSNTNLQNQSPGYRKSSERLIISGPIM